MRMSLVTNIKQWAWVVLMVLLMAAPKHGLSQVSTTNAGAAFTCDASFYQTRAGAGSTALLRFPASALSSGGAAQNVYSALIPVELNALGFRRQDGYQYALQSATQQPRLYRIGQGGVQPVGNIVNTVAGGPALTSGFFPTAGFFDTQGRYYFLGQGGGNITPSAVYRVDNFTPDGSGNIQAAAVFPLSATAGNMGDLVLGPDGNLYGATGTTLYQIRIAGLSNGQTAQVRTRSIGDVGGVGSAFLNDAGDLFVFANGTGTLSKVNFSFGTAFETSPVSSAPASSINVSSAGPLPSSTAASDGGSCVDDRADMQAQTPVLPNVVSPGSTITTNAVCVNNGPAGATAPTCNITSNIPGATVTVGTCTPPLPVDALRASAGNNTISCPVTIQIPGTPGGSDVPLNTGSLTVTAGSASPDPTPSNNQSSKTFTVIDAVDDPLVTIPQGQSAIFPVLGNDTVGNQPASLAAGPTQVTLTLVSSPGLTGANAPTVDASGNITIPASAPPGNYTLTYQICAVPAQTPPACDTAIKPITITPKATIDTRKSAGTPQDLGSGRFLVPFAISVGNSGATPVPNVQAIENLQRAFPGATVTAGPVTITPTGAATCSPPAATFNGIGNNALLSGSNTLNQGQGCNFSFTTTVDYGSIAAVPSTAQKNTVYASGSSTANNPGHTVPNNPATPATPPSNAVATDESTDRPVTPPGAPGAVPAAPGVPSSPGSDAPDPTPVSFRPQTLDVLKSASRPIQLDTSGKRFRVAYAVTIANTSNSTTATNVQAGENLKFTFPAPATFSVSGVQIMAGASAATCAANLNAQFDGGAGYTGGNAENYNLLRNSADANNKASNMNLGPSQFCQVSFVVDVDYGSSTVPATPAQNRVFGQTAASPNKGATFDPSTGTKTGDAPDLINKDTSEAVVPTTPTYGGVPPAPPAPPSTPKQNPGSSTNANFATLEVVKRVAGGVTRTGPSTFDVPYEITIKAIGSPGVTLTQVQTVDSLRATYSAGSPNISVSGFGGTALGGATCTPNASYNGVGDIRLLAGTDDWVADQQGCTFRFTATVAYPSIASVPTTAQQNSAYASAVSDTNNANTPNTGGSVDPTTGVWTPPTPSGGQQVIAKDRSTDAAPVPTSSAQDTPSPTPVNLSGIAQLPTDMRVALTGLPDTAAPGAVVNGVLICTNQGTSAAISATCTATVGNSATIVVGTCVASTGTAALLPAGATLSCPVQITMPGAVGGNDVSQEQVPVTGNTNASNDNNPNNNSASDIINIIDAVNDAPQTVPRGQAAALNVLGNDTVGTQPATAANVTVTLISSPGLTGANAPTVNSSGQIIVPATAPAGSYTITYQICAVPAQTPPACDTATKPLTITAQPVIDVRKSAGTPQQIGPASYAVPFAISVGNNGPDTVPNVQAIENLQRAFPGAVVTVGPVTITVVSGATCSPPATTFNGTGNNALLSGSNSLAQGQRCDFAFIATVDYGSAGAVPTTAQRNTVYASGTSTPNNPGHAVPNTGPVTSPTNAITVDESTDRPAVPPGAPGAVPPAPGVPGTSGGDVPDPTPVSFTTQAIDVRKSSSYAVQLDTSGRRFRLFYTVNVTNTSASVTATNVQLSENLRFTFPAPTAFNIVPGSVQLLSGAGSAAACNVNTAFNGESQPQLLGAGGNSTISLNAGERCVVTFGVDVDYSSSAVPATPAQNRVFGSTANSANSGALFDANGVKTGDAPNLISKDTSTDVTPVGGRPFGAPPADPGAPTVSKGDAGSGTPAIIGTLETVKKVTGPVVRTNPTTFQIPYEVTVQAVGNGVVTLTQVQAVDNLSATFASGAPIVTTSALSGTPINGAVCSVNNSFNGTSNIGLLAGTDDWATGQGCTLRFTATVAYPNVASVPATAQQNTVYASSVSDSTNANAPNTGGTVDSSGVWTPPAPPGGQVVIAKDQSTDAAPVPPGSALDTPSPTPVDLSVIPQVPSDMRVAINGLPVASAPGATVTGTLVCTNNGPSEAVAVTCNATVGSGASIVVGACTASSGSASILPVGATLSCPVQITLQGTPGGSDTAAQQIIVNGTTGASNDTNTTNNTTQAPINVIDAIDDPAQTVPQGQAVTLNVLSNDGAGTLPASAANVTVTVVSGAPAGTTVDSNGNLVVPANAPPGNYTITYRICAQPATTPPACDTATKPLTITALPVIDTRKSAGTPQDLGSGRFLVPFAISVGNSGATPVPNVQAIENLQRTFPGATIIAGPVTIAPTGGATCSPPASAFNGVGNNALLSGSNTLNQGQGCNFSFTATVDYGSIAAVPATAQRNTVYASGSSTPNNPGHTVPNSGPVTSPTNAVTVDESTDRPVTPPGAPGAVPPAPGLPGTPGSDVPDPTPVSFRPQTLDVLKSASTPIQLDTSGKRFRVAYAITIANTSPDTTATNVQAGENLRFTYPAPASFSVSNVALGAGSNAVCANHLNAQFDGGAGYNSAADAKNYNLLRNSADANNKASNMNLPPRTVCQISFVVEVNYGSGTVPSAPAQNRVFGQTAASPNEGAIFDPATGTKTGDAPDLINKDTSEAVVPAVPSYGGTLPAFPPIPATPKQNPGSSTNANFATLEVVKRVAGTIVRTAPSTFQVPYEITVQAVGSPGVTLTQVQTVDSLRATFNAGNPTISVTPALAGTPVGGATCSVNAAYNGVADIRLLSGTNDWVVGQGCTLRFTATVAYSSVAAIPVAAQENNAYASAISPDAGDTPNTGGTVDPATGVWTPPTPPAGQQVIAKDRSTDAAPVPPSSALDTPSPTPALMVAPPTIVGLKYAELPNAVGGTAIPGNTVRWTIIYKNTSAQPATNVRVTDVLDPNLTSPVIVSVSPAGFSANTAYTGIAPNAELLNAGGTLPAGGVLRIVLETQIRSTSTAPQVTNNAVLRADELGGSGPGAITVPTSAAGPTLPPCPSAQACNPDPASITIPSTAVGGQPTGVGGNTTVPLVAPGGISGRVWIDGNGNGQLDGGEPTLGGYRVAIYAVDPTTGQRVREVTNSASRPVTQPDGSYSVSGLPPTGPNLTYDVVFFNENGDSIMGVPRGNNTNTALNGAPNNARNALTNVRVQPNVVTSLQDLPLDPSGVVYDSNTRQPIPGAQVQLVRIVGGVPTPVPAGDLAGGQNTVTTGPSGVYQFILTAAAPAGQYELRVTPPPGYSLSTQIPPSPGPVTPGVGAVCPGQGPGQQCQIQPQGTAPAVGQATTYYFGFNLAPGASPDVVHNHIPLDLGSPATLFITKVANKTTVEMGDTLQYKVRVRYAAGGAPLTTLSINDILPAGFRLIAGTSVVAVPATAAPTTVPAASITGAPGASLTFALNGALGAGGVPVGTEIELTYRVRVGVGSMQGDGINRARATGNGRASNLAQAQVKVTGGVFANEGCIVGKVYADCNNNHMQDPEELGVPGVRMYLNDGTYFVSDSEGKYSLCGLEPKSWVLKVDQITLPRGSRLTTSSNRNLGNADSLWVDLKNGELHQADFIIGSCSNTVLEQVKARRNQGGTRSVDTERQGGPALKFEGKSPGYPDQGTDSANQPLVQPRPSGPPGSPGAPSNAENNTPVPQLPSSSGSTRGNNLRDAK
jgi:uncharacterized repeat protein (TIGR01451 family)